MDPQTALTIITSALGGAATGGKLIEKLLGPTFDYLGVELKNWTERGAQNFGRVISNGITKLGDKIESEGSVPPKVFRGILDEGPFCDDPLTAEYFGGVLASSRSGILRDDRGAMYLSLISRLSAYQIRSHYIFYHVYKRVFDGQQVYLGSDLGERDSEIYLPIDVWEQAMDFSEQEKPQLIVNHVLFGLAKEYLIGKAFCLMSVDNLKTGYTFTGSTEMVSRNNLQGVTKDGILFMPAIPGIELFLWAYGRPEISYSEVCNTDNLFPLDPQVQLSEGYKKSFLTWADFKPGMTLKIE